MPNGLKCDGRSNRVEGRRYQYRVIATGLTFMGTTVVPLTIGSAHANGLRDYKVCMAIPPVRRLAIVAPIVHMQVTPKNHYLNGRGVPQEMWDNPMAAAMAGEAADQPDIGRYAVGHVIMNRLTADRDSWGHSILEVCTKRKQFSWLNLDDPGFERVKAMVLAPKESAPHRLWEHLKVLSNDVLSGRHRDNTGGATSYRVNNAHAWWDYTMTVTGVMYAHTFFKPKTGHDLAQAIADHKANAKLEARRHRESIRLERARRKARKANAVSHGRAVRKTVGKVSVRLPKQKMITKVFVLPPSPTVIVHTKTVSKTVSKNKSTR